MEAACCTGVVVLRDVIVEVFKVAHNVLHLEIKHHVVARSTGGALHTGVLTKMFAMSVLYLKTIDVFFKRKSFDKSVH